MALDFSLLGNPTSPLQVLQSLALGQQRVQQEQDRAMQMQRQGIEDQYREREFGLKERQLGLSERKAGMDARKAEYEPFAQAVMDIERRPEAERPALWDQYVDYFVQQGHGEAAQLKGRYSSQAARGILAETGYLDDFLKQSEPSYQVIPQGGKLQGFQFGQPMTGGAPAASGPQPGAVEDGYRFKGGNPADPSAWEPVQGGPSQPATGGFR